MNDKLIIVIGIVCVVAFFFLANLWINYKWANRIINLALFVSLFILPDSIACVCFVLLVFRMGIWLFGPGQDLTDDIRYTRYRNARTRYNIKHGIQEEKVNKAKIKKIKKTNDKELEKEIKEAKENTKKMNIMFNDDYKKMMSDYSKKITSIESLTKDDMYNLVIAYKKALLNKDSSMINKLQNVNSKDDITKEIKKYFKEEGV